MTDEAGKVSRQDVAGGIPPGRIEAARRTYAQAMGDDETPLAIFLDFKHRKAARGMLITDRFIYSAHMPVALPLDRIDTVRVTGGGFTPEKLRINGAAVLVHKTIDSLSVDILSRIRSEIGKRKLRGKLVGADPGRSTLTNEQFVRDAADGLASGVSKAELQTRLQGNGMDAESADLLVRGLMALSEPGNIASGAVLIFTGVMCLGLVVFLLIAPMSITFNPIFLILGAFGALIMVAIGIGAVRSVKKRRTDPEGLTKSWLAFLAPNRLE